MPMKDIILCNDLPCVKWSTYILAGVNSIVSGVGVVWWSLFFPTRVELYEQFYQDEDKKFEEKLKYLWTIFVLALLPLIGNLIFTIFLLFSLRLRFYKFFTYWHGWMCLSFILFTALFIVIIVDMGFHLEVMIICLSFMIVNLYLGLLLILIRRELVKNESTKSIPS